MVKADSDDNAAFATQQCAATIVELNLGVFVFAILVT
jgi:hypothetical protein